MFSIFWNGLYFNVEAKERVKRAYFSKAPAFGFEKNELSKKLERYFSGERIEFDCEVELNLPEFTRSVLERVSEIKYGKVATYAEIAEELNSSPRAVGQALRRNPVAVIIPCHRVVAKDGIGGYSAGVEIKRALLRLEGIQFP